MQDFHRKFCRKQHRVVGVYLAIQAWLKGVDGLAVDRTVLEKLLGLERFQDARVEDLKTDLREWFPHFRVFVNGRGPESLASLWLSRLPLENLPLVEDSDEKRAERLEKSGGPRIAAMRSVSEVPTEEGLVSYLALLADGLANPRSVYDIREADHF